ncbi:MAG: hypothetical protein ACWGQW_26350, partial [bacterium]
MAIYEFANNHLAKVDTTSFSSEGILERFHLQMALKDQIEIIAPDTLVIAEEFSEWSGSKRRIDLLAIDINANLVVIELKRDETGEHMDLQALRYAAMVSTLTFKRAVEIFQKHLDASDREEDATTILLEFLGWDEPQEDDFAVDVRIILVSADFSKELTTSVMWLNERSLDIRCVRLIPYRFEDRILIDVQQVIPLPEAESYQIRIRQKSEERREARRTQRDFTKYRFKCEIYNKRRLVLAVVWDWVRVNKLVGISDLEKAFPQELRPGGVFAPVSKARSIFERQGRRRHFLGEDEIIVL